MVGQSSSGPSKRPRTDNLLEDVDIRNRMRELEEENKRLKEVEQKVKELEEVEKENRGVMAELMGMVECPVCLLVPKQGGPVPVCSNGHFVCRTCRDRIRQEAVLPMEPKCPTCLGNLGNATSLLASRVIERIKHECDHDGCGEMVSFADLKKHERGCLFRKVLCPGAYCELEVPFNKVVEHVRDCHGVEEPINDDEVSFSQNIKKIEIGTRECVTEIVRTSEKLFFVRSKTENHSYFVEVSMLGSEEDCKEYLATMTILDDDDNTFFKTTCRPRPISLEKWGDMGLVVSKKALSSIWRPDGEDFVFDVDVSVEKL